MSAYVFLLYNLKKKVVTRSCWGRDRRPSSSGHFNVVSITKAPKTPSLLNIVLGPLKTLMEPSESAKNSLWFITYTECVRTLHPYNEMNLKQGIVYFMGSWGIQLLLM